MPPVTTHSGLVQPSTLFAVEARRQLESGDVLRAIDTCKRGLARFPEHAAGYVILAAAYRAIGQESRAQLVLSRGYARTGVAALGSTTSVAPADVPMRDADVATEIAVEPIVGDEAENEAEAIAPEIVESGGVEPELAAGEIESTPAAADEPAATDEQAEVDEPTTARGSDDAGANGALRVHEHGTSRPLPAWLQRRARRDEPSRATNLALHSALGAHRVRSANPRLIPGLELSPLRHEESNGRVQATPAVEQPMPEWTLRHRPVSSGTAREIRGEYRNRGAVNTPPSALPVGTDAPATEAESSAVGEAAASAIEELARRLEGARIPPVPESSGYGRPSFEPSIVSDTIAEILVNQGAFAEALKAFQTLARLRPDRVDYYEAQIARMRRLISGQSPAGA